MKLKVSQLLAAHEAFGRLAKEKLPPKGGYWVARMLTKLGPEVTVAEQRRVALIQEVGVSDGSNGWKVPEEKVAEFIEKWGPILQEEIDVDTPTVKLEHFGDRELPVVDLIAVEPFIDG